MKKWKNALNYKRDLSDKNAYEYVEGASMTVQGESLTIAELIQRQLNGIDPRPGEAVYLDQEDLDKIGRHYRPLVDLTDLDELREENAAIELQIKRFQEAQKQKEKERKEKEEKPESPAPEKPETEDD